jgi:hypothetical protein
MATVEEALIVFKGQDQMGNTANKVKNDLNGVDSQARRTTGGLGGLGQAMVGLGAAFAGTEILMFFKNSIAAAGAAEDSWGKFSVAMGGTAMEAGNVRQEWQSTVDGIAEDTGRGVGSIKKTMNDLAIAGIRDQGLMKNSVEMITGTAAKMGTPVEEISEKFKTITMTGMASNKMLKSMGLTTDDLGMSVADFKNKTVEERTAILNGALAKKNAAAGNEYYKQSYEGMVEEMNNMWQKFMVTVGNELLPVVKDIAKVAMPILEGMLNIFKQLPSPVKDLLIVLPLAVAGIALVGGAMTMASPVIGALGSLAGTGGLLGKIPGLSKLAGDSLSSMPCPPDCVSGGGKGGKTKTVQTTLEDYGPGAASAGGGGIGAAAMGIAVPAAVAVGAVFAGLAAVRIGQEAQAGNIHPIWTPQGQEEARTGTVGGGIFTPVGTKERMVGLPEALGLGKPEEQIPKWFSGVQKQWATSDKGFDNYVRSGARKTANDFMSGLQGIPAWLGGLGRRLTQIWGGVTSYFSGAWQNTIAWFTNGKNIILGAMGNVYSSILNAWNIAKGAFNSAYSTISSVMGNIVSTIQSNIANAVGFLRSFLCPIIGCSPGIIPAFKEMGRVVPAEIGRIMPALGRLNAGVPTFNGIGIGGGTHYHQHNVKIDARHLSAEQLVPLLVQVYEGRLTAAPTTGGG